MRVKRKDGGGGLAQPARFTPWSLGKAHQEKLTSLGRRVVIISSYLASLSISGHWEAFNQLLLKDCPSSWINGLLCLLSRFFK